MKSEFLFSFLLIFLLILFLEPFDLFMSPPFLTMITLGLIIIFSVFASIIWREKTRDEREKLHRHIAGRFGYLAGAAVLVIGITYQAFHHAIDVWLVIALITMVFGKIIGFAYGQKAH